MILCLLIQKSNFAARSTHTHHARQLQVHALGKLDNLSSWLTGVWISEVLLYVHYAMHTCIYSQLHLICHLIIIMPIRL